MKPMLALGKFTTLAAISVMTTISVPALASTPTAPVGFYAENSTTYVGEQYAQNSDFADLRPSTIRRMQFYSETAITALVALDQEDQAAGESGAALNSTTSDTLRNSIERLIEAGEKAGLDVDRTALFFSQQIGAVFTDGVYPLIVQDAEGNLNAQNLLRGVALNTAVPAPSNAEADYIALVKSQGVTAGQGGETTAPAPAPVVAPVVEAAVEAAIVRDPAIQAVWDRIVMDGDRRTIKVRKGDTLATFAAIFFGDALLYRKIFAANSGTIKSPNFLEVGLVITIPN